MKRKYLYFIGGAILIAAFISSVYVIYRQSEYLHEGFQEKFEEGEIPSPERMKDRFHEQKETLKSVFEFNVLTTEAGEDAEVIAQSDEVVNAILQVLGDTEVEAYRGPVKGRAILKYTSEKEWMLQVMVNLDSQRVESITLTRGIMPLVVNPKELVQIAEKEFPRNEFGTPFLRKVAQSDEGAEVVFLTDKGSVIIRVNPEEGRVIGLEKHAARAPFRWVLPILAVAAVVGILVLLVALRRGPESVEAEEVEGEAEEEVEGPEEGKSQ